MNIIYRLDTCKLLPNLSRNNKATKWETNENKQSKVSIAEEKKLLFLLVINAPHIKANMKIGNYFQTNGEYSPHDERRNNNSRFI